jgi:predicted N-acyltransferase
MFTVMTENPTVAAPVLRYRILRSVAEVTATDWDRCANAPGAEASERFNPFLAHAFFRALEESGSIGGTTGWSGAYAAVFDSGGRLVAVAPSFLKTHSMGEYVFDQRWAEAYARAGGRYYPKIQVATPFTPVTGRRLLYAPDAPGATRDALIAALGGLNDRIGASSIHVAFPTETDSAALETAGFLPRIGVQFHFFNEGYRDFDDFLDRIPARKRKAIRRERRAALGDDLEIDLLTGPEIEPRHWAAFYDFYLSTAVRKWGQPYLTRGFFERIGALMPERVLLVMARRGADYIAGAINFLGDDAIYGRNWGALEDRPFLHFEVCYYQAIDFAIRRGYRRVEAGAQGEHKLARGYRPVVTRSAHAFADPALRDAVADYLRRETPAVAALIGQATAALPFRAEK